MGRFLDEWVLRSKTSEFLAADPISIPYRYVEDPLTCELVSYLTILFSYGRRDLIIQIVDAILKRFDTDPYTFVTNFDLKKDGHRLDGFVYRFYKSSDLVFLIERLSHVYREYGSLEQCFDASRQVVSSQQKVRPQIDYVRSKLSPIQQQLATFTDCLLAGEPVNTYGQKFMFAHPNLGGPCKRLNMFLRWMVRQDEPGQACVDLGLWKQSLKPSELIIPLDTHVTKMNKLFGFSKRKAADWQTAEEITQTLRQFCPEDPLKYDFALMGLGLNNITASELEKLIKT